VNLVLLFPEDFISVDVVRVTGRRREHILSVLRANAGDVLVVGVAGGKIGRGTVLNDAVEMRVVLDREPPPPLHVTLVVALPRPKVLNRVVASATSMGVKRIYLINAWRVEKSYWKSPRLSTLGDQAILGLEQARDTILPKIELRRLFRPFVETELPEIAKDSLRLVAHPGGEALQRAGGPVTLVVGPEGGFIERELQSLEAAGFAQFSIGTRILRVETAVAALLARVTSDAPIP
jgi:16S rRNA (uracil1498-N3)-methyltransferase